MKTTLALKKWMQRSSLRLSRLVLKSRSQLRRLKRPKTLEKNGLSLQFRLKNLLPHRQREKNKWD